MRGTVFLVGCLGLAVPSTSIHVIEIAPEEIRRRSFARSHLIVVGAAAIERLDADAAWKLLAPVRDRVVLSVADAVDPGRFASWLRHGFRFMEPEELRRQLVPIEPRASRPTVAFDGWLPCAPTPDGAARCLVGLVAHLPRLTVDAWAQAAGVSRSHILRTCRREFGLSARQVLQRYLLGASHELRQSRRRVRECAEILGFADPATMRRALRRARGNLASEPRGCKRPPGRLETAPLNRPKAS